MVRAGNVPPNPSLTITRIDFACQVAIIFSSIAVTINVTNQVVAGADSSRCEACWTFRTTDGACCGRSTRAIVSIGHAVAHAATRSQRKYFTFQIAISCSCIIVAVVFADQIKASRCAARPKPNRTHWSASFASVSG
jgi:hypothetical protein